MDRRWKTVGLLFGVSLAFAAQAVSPPGPASDDASDPALLAQASSPTAEPRAVIDGLIANNVAAAFGGLRKNVLTDMQDEWERSRERKKAAVSGKGLAEAMPQSLDLFTESMSSTWTRLLTVEGAESLVAQWQPMFAEQSVEKVGQANIALAGLIGELASDPKLGAAERLQLIDLLSATQAWLMRTDWSDPQRLRKAVQAFSTAVRASGVESYAAFADLEFVEAISRWDLFLHAAKQAAAAYDLPVDAILRSVVIDEVSRVGDDATVRYQFSVFGVPASTTVELRYHQGQWMERETVEHRQRTQARREQTASASIDDPESASPDAAQPAAAPMHCGKPSAAEID